MLNLLAPASCVPTRLLAIPRKWAQLLCLAKCSCGGGCIPYLRSICGTAAHALQMADKHGCSLKEDVLHSECAGCIWAAQIAIACLQPRCRPRDLCNQARLGSSHSP